ncbi:permease, partial [Candidatus Bipolaricaulota bacterium]|nr:permease [Candidatus Bipolaricaulota bacterium]
AAFSSLRARLRVKPISSSSCGCPTSGDMAYEAAGCGCTTHAETHSHVHGSPCCQDAGAEAAATEMLKSDSTAVWYDRTKRIIKESISATIWVGQFLILAFFLEALIKLYVPQDLIIQWIGASNPLAPAFAAIVGIPLYTGNLMALPLIGGLLEHGMDPGAALAFLISGPVTTICAMTAVLGVVKRRIFLLYVGIGLVGALVLGYGYSFLSAILSS